MLFLWNDPLQTIVKDFAGPMVFDAHSLLYGPAKYLLNIAADVYQRFKASPPFPPSMERLS